MTLFKSKPKKKTVIIWSVILSILLAIFFSIYYFIFCFSLSSPLRSELPETMEVYRYGEKYVFTPDDKMFHVLYNKLKPTQKLTIYKYLENVVSFDPKATPHTLPFSY